jgi:phospholipase C
MSLKMERNCTGEVNNSRRLWSTKTLGRLGNQSFDASAGSLNDMFDFSKGHYNPPVFLDPNRGEPVTSVKPFTATWTNLYMAVGDLARSLDVQVYNKNQEGWFLYGGHLVEIPYTERR